jgi:NDP-sugar pyrophosphorylase family protein
MRAVILAAGLGRRLRPITDQRSKAMVPILGRPLVERAMMPLVANGITDFVLVVGPADSEIRRHFRERAGLGIDTECVVQEERAGMAHALGLAAPLLDGPFVVSACDSLVPALHVRELLHAFEGADAALSLLDVEPDAVTRSATVALEGGRVTRIVEKPGPGEALSTTVSLPLYVLPRRLLDLLPVLKRSSRGEVELQEAIQTLIDDGARVVGVRTTERVQVSSAEDLLDLNRRLLRAAAEPELVAPARVGSGTVFRRPLRIEAGVEIGAGCEIGPDAYLEGGCRIGERAIVRDALVLRGARVSAGECVEGRVVSAGAVAELR